MPMSTRRQAQRAERDNTTVVEVADLDQSSEGLPSGVAHDVAESEEIEVEGDEEEVQVEVDETPFPPPGLKEISSLASWTVSTAKPGNGVAALRSPDTNHFWQSDGPQPHLLSIHFFKLVSIVHIRIYLDFAADESYTPTKIQFLAGMGIHDIQEFAEMSFEQPTGWIDVDFSNVGPIEEEEGEPDTPREIDWSKRPVLRAFLVQVRILENHQNGKDTHLRAVQLFARDETQQTRPPVPLAETNSNAGQNLRKRLPSLHSKHAFRRMQKEANNIKLASWMMDPDMR
ncbi:Anaphase-promoting complex subunit 10 [Fulvia fulva]|uniref:Anaphase-promoting complex subunit 10 n=1 Tax=Passalora fulva TaxID=5499 RepID=A0A9Q8LAR6_PASFU|nr:Anaphase-promoting complex subunit 10 [Fulvia fulva]KAK4632370.1 Anaphase-promoting complex subunit 10 [Fulvia fulva]KAK4633118.1 Anaphase-promoting complex subunit 10 [Fulvia fulva]UJO13915.1 Anaphase-promoting complex subunit 10 [Fulvia fulva]WPV11389.1 Anaphase-promoting complex subunit 10 [Fulvia fulva]WPV26839.1 Anaphase-promoting complex subunit 10 [Fulvia fulva]